MTGFTFEDPGMHRPARSNSLIDLPQTDAVSRDILPEQLQKGLLISDDFKGRPAFQTVPVKTVVKP